MYIRIGRFVINLSFVVKVDTNDAKGTTSVYLQGQAKPIVFKKHSKAAWSYFKSKSTTVSPSPSRAW